MLLIGDVRKSFVKLIENKIKEENVVFDDNFEMLQLYVSKILDSFEIEYDTDDVVIISNVIMDNIQYKLSEIDLDNLDEFEENSAIAYLEDCIESAIDEIGGLSVEIDNWSFQDIMELSEKIDSKEIPEDSPIAEKFFMLQFFRSKLGDMIESFQAEVEKFSDEYEADKKQRESVV